MHSAERAKQRRLALEERIKSDHQCSTSSMLSSSHSMSSFSMGPKKVGSLDRNRSNGYGRQSSDKIYPNFEKGIRGGNTFEGSIQRTRTSSGNGHGRGISGGPDSDSGLSGFEIDEHHKHRDGRESKTESAVDSGRRTQSLENLSEDLASVSLSSPVSSPSPRPPTDDQIETEKCSSKSLPRGHVHFLPNENLNQVHLSSNGLNQISSHAGDGRLPRSSSIPVHLTISNSNCQALPPSLRPDSSLSISQHEPGCAMMMTDRKLCPLLSSSGRTYSSSPSINGSGTFPRRGPNSLLGRTSTPTRTRTFSSSSNTSSRARANSALDSRCSSSAGTCVKSSTLPRRSTSSCSLATNSSTMSSRAKASTIVTLSGSQKSFDAENDLDGSVPLATGSAPTLKQPLRRRAIRGPKVLNTSMEIWEIQKQLKRGEMVQGVLSFGPTRAFGSRVPEKDEPSICAPVTIGRTSGHMDWRCM